MTLARKSAGRTAEPRSGHQALNPSASGAVAAPADFTMKKSPIEELNNLIAAARAEANNRLEAIRQQKNSHAHTSPSIPPGSTPSEASRVTMEHAAEASRLRKAEQSFSVTSVLMELDDDVRVKSLLVAAQADLTARHERVRKQAEPSLVAALRSKFGRAVGEDDVSPSPRCPLPQGGPFGTVVEKPIEDELAALAAEVEAFPDRTPLFKLLPKVNELAARLAALLAPEEKQQEPYRAAHPQRAIA